LLEPGLLHGERKHTCRWPGPAPEISMTGPRVGSTVPTQTAPVLAEGAPRRARVLAVTLLCLLFGSRALDLLGGITFRNVTTSSYLQVLWTAALFVVPVLYAFPGPLCCPARLRADLACGHCALA